MAPILGCVSKIVRGEMSEAVRACERVRTIKFFGARYR